MKKIYLFIASLAITAFTTAGAQQLDPQKETETYTIDNLGDAHVEVSRFYNANQWDNYKKIYGSNAEQLLKREEERSIPSAYLDNFTYKEQDQSWTLTYDAMGFAKINDNGQWEIDIPFKNPDITKISDLNYVINVSYNFGGNLLNDLIKINLPPGSANSAQDKNSLGKPIFTYELTPGRKGAHLLFLAAGILLIAAGAVAYFKPDLLSSIGKKDKAVKPFTVVSSQAPAAATPEPPANPGIEKQA